VVHDSQLIDNVRQSNHNIFDSERLGDVAMQPNLTKNERSQSVARTFGTVCRH